MAVEETSSGDALHWLPRERRLSFGAHLGDCGDEDCGRHVASVPSSFTPLSANDVGANIETFLDVFWVADHVHVEYAGFVETVDDSFRRDADGGDE